MDDEFYAELAQTFILEFEELMDLYKESLKTIKKKSADDEEKADAYESIFRVFHTLKGDSSYFPEYESFTNFTKEFCEVLRPLNEEVFSSAKILHTIQLNYTRLSSALSALKKGKSLEAYSFSKY